MNKVSVINYKLKHLCSFYAALGLASLISPELVFGHGFEVVNGQFVGNSEIEFKSAPPAQGQSNPAATPVTQPSPSAQYARPAEIGESYQRALEVESLMADFVIEKINQIRWINENLQGSRRLTSLNELLGSYCLVDDKTDPKYLTRLESIDDCAQRYIILQKPLLGRMQSAILKNENQQARLKCNQFDDKGNCTSTSGSVPIIGMDAMYQVPDAVRQAESLQFVPTYQELQNFAAKKKHSLTNPQFKSGYDTWMKKNYPDRKSSPALEDYIQYKTVPKDPNNPKGEYWTVIKTNDKGEPLYDTEKYNTALTEWQVSRDALLASFKEDPSTVKPLMATLTGPGAQAAHDLQIDEFVNDPENADTMNKTASNYRAYAAARSRLIGHVNADTVARLNQAKGGAEGKGGNKADLSQPPQQTAGTSGANNTSNSGAPAGGAKGSSASNNALSTGSLPPDEKGFIYPVTVSDGREIISPPKGASGQPGQNASRVIYKPDSFDAANINNFTGPSLPRDRHSSSILQNYIRLAGEAQQKKGSQPAPSNAPDLGKVSDTPRDPTNLDDVFR